MFVDNRKRRILLLGKGHGVYGDFFGTRSLGFGREKRQEPPFLYGAGIVLNRLDAERLHEIFFQEGSCVERRGEMCVESAIDDIFSQWGEHGWTSSPVELHILA